VLSARLAMVMLGEESCWMLNGFYIEGHMTVAQAASTACAAEQHISTLKLGIQGC
jgi:hypothetical protein